MSATHGQCYCGAISYHLSGAPLSFQHCHCKQCQQLHGAAFVTWVGFNVQDFTCTDPHQNLRTFNSGQADRSFCATCGTRLFFRYTCPRPHNETNVSYIYVPATTITQTSAELSPGLNGAKFMDKIHIYQEENPSWTHSFVTLPQ